MPMESYKVLKRIGVGTYGSAYLVCLKDNPQAQFVLKKIKIDEDDSKEKAQAELEVQVLAQLDHPLVLSYIDHFMYKGHLCIITDYCEAGDMYTLVRNRKTPLLEGQILEWLVQVVMAIQYVHAKNILHRDLKTQNIFLTKDNNIKLGDFGISRPLNSSIDLASTLVGTPYYMSPEVMSSQPYDYKSDMWSMGCCVYEMMSGKHAFDATDMSSLVLKIMRGEHLPIPAQYSPDLRDLAKALLSKNPKSRPSPDAILKLPWLKEYVARTRDKLQNMQRTPYRSRAASGASAGGSPALAAVISSGGPVAAGRRVSGDAHGIDRELEAAKARLRAIQAERDALALAAAASRQAAAAVAAGGRAPSGSSSSPPHAAGGAPNSPPKRPPLPPPGAAAPGSGGGAGGWRQGREDSPDLSERGGGGGVSGRASGNGQQVYSSSPSSQQPVDPRARREARKAEELRKREAELLEARKAYFEERKQAEAMKRHMIHGTTGSTGPFSTRNRSTTGEARLSGEMSGLHLGGGGGGGGDSDEDEGQARGYNGGQYSGGYGGGHRHQGSSGPYDAAAAEFEEELRYRPQVALQPQLLRTFGGGGGGGMVPAQAGAVERAAALRELCVQALGLQLFDLMYSVVRSRLGQSEDQYFRQELLVRLGPHRMQYVTLVDQLVYYEDQAGLAPSSNMR